MEIDEMGLASSYKSFVDKIFEIYHLANYGLGEGTTLWKVRGVFAKEEDTIRMHKAYIVLSNLMDNQYLAYAAHDPSLVVLTQKGMDYISGSSPLVLDVDLNKYIDIDNVSVDEAFNRLWELVGNAESSLFYIEKNSIYSVAQNISTILPKTLAAYIDSLPNETTSEKSVFEELMGTMSASSRKEWLHELSSLIEEKYTISKLKNQYVEWEELKPAELF